MEENVGVYTTATENPHVTKLRAPGRAVELFTGNLM